MGAIFMSASVPTLDPNRKDYWSTADVVSIRSAVLALVRVALGRRLIVWGGHPSITPMVWAVAEDLGVDYAQCVHLYQSRYFEADFPKENRRFRNVTLVDAVPGDLKQSLESMRSKMFKSHDFESGVFIGGMEGIWDEFRLLRKLAPNTLLFPIASCGGAALEIFEKERVFHGLQSDRDFIGLFHRILRIAPNDNRDWRNFGAR